MRIIFKLAALALSAAMLYSCGGKEENGGGGGGGNSKVKDPTVFAISGGLGSYTAESQSFNITVLCDVKWNATLGTGSWAKVTSQVDNGDQTGTITVKLSLNPEDALRTDVLTVKAGNQTKSFNVNQRGITSIISTTQVNLVGVAEQYLDFTTKNAWTASITDNADWYTIDPVSGPAGLSRMTITPLDPNVNVGSRTSSLKVTIGSENFNIPVVQVQKNAIIVDVDQTWTNYEEADITIDTHTNVDFNVRIEDEATWLTLTEVKALNKKTVRLHAEANPTSIGRQAYVYFELDDISEPVLVRQGAYNAIISQTIPGVVNLGDTSFEYRPGKDQLTVHRGLLTDTYRFLDPLGSKVIEITGVPKELSEGDSFIAGVSVMDKLTLALSTNYVMYVVKVTDDELWLSSDNDLGFILKK